MLWKRYGGTGIGYSDATSVLNTPNIHLGQEVLQSFWKLLSSSSSYGIFKMNIFALLNKFKMNNSNVFTKTFSRRVQGIFITSCNVLKQSSRHLQDIFKTSWNSCKDIFKTSSKRLKDGLSSWTVLVNMYLRVFNWFSGRATKTTIYRNICLGHTSEKFMVRVGKNFLRLSY